MRSLLAAAVVVGLALPSAAAGARYAVGVREGASVEAVAARVAAVTGGRISLDLAPLDALTVEAESAGGLAGLPGVAYVEELRPSRRLAFEPNDPLAPRQWYLAQDRAFDLWPQRPSLPGVRVAVIDTGIDLGHPEFAGRIAAARSFVGGTVTDVVGHGTFIAGEIAAATNNGIGIAGLAFPAQLIVAKVVDTGGTISPENEARAIRWAVDRGARVVNLSIGGLRDPLDPERDTYSPLEQSAVEYATRHRAVVVAAVGNGDEAPKTPWSFASYPAALPHVLGVSALARNGSVPSFSNRDAVFNDVAAPGEEIVSTYPRSLTAQRTGCVEQGYSLCGPLEYRHAEGTSFAVPQVAAAAALLLSVRPRLAPDQVTALIERSAEDVNAATGCRVCPLQRDALSGWGRLDILAALQALDGPLPMPPDSLEANDDAGARAATLWGATRTIDATVDYWDDPVDVYRVKLAAGQTIDATLKGPARVHLNLVLWRPGTDSVDDLSPRTLALRAAQSAGEGTLDRMTYTSFAAGWYYLEVAISTAGGGGYTLTLTKS